MVGMNIGNFDVDLKFIADVRTEYDELRSKMGIPHDADVPEDDPPEDDNEDDDGARGGDAAAAAAAADIAAEE